MNQQMENQKKDSLIETNGFATGLDLNKKRLIAFIVAIALFVVGALLPLSAYGENAGVALGLVMATIALWVFNVVPTIIPALIMMVVALMLNLLDLGTVQSTLGSSAVYVTMGLVIVSMGAENSNIAKRLACFLGEKLGKRPTLILLALLLASAIMSAFVSNTATAIMMSGIGAGVLKAMGEEPGKSKFGSALILLICAGTAIGGGALINGCPGINGMCISLLENATGMSIAYVDWAKFGVLSAIFLVIPCWYIYMKFAKVKSSELTSIDPQYFKKLSKEMGPLGGSEIRWIITVTIMIICLLCGMPLPTAGLLFGTISMLPVVGTVNGEKAMKSMPFTVIIMCGMVPLYGNLFNNTGLSTFFGEVVGSIIPKNSVFFAIIIPALLMAVLNNLFVNAGAGIAAICIGAVAPVMVAMGYNPVTCLLPTMMLGGYTIGFGTHVQMMITYGYGYWEMNEVYKPGFTFVTVTAVILSVLLFFTAPILGMSFYL